MKAPPLLALLSCAGVSTACGSRSDFDAIAVDGGRIDAGREREGSGGTTSSGGRAPSSGGAVSSSGGAVSSGGGAVSSGGVRDAGSVERDAGRDAEHDAGIDAGARDGGGAGIVDARSDAFTPDALMSPDCTCPDLGFFIDANMGGVPMHLTAPYTLGIYCTETTVQVAHPPCSEVYRISGCNGDHYAPPCLYMGFEVGRGLLLGDVVDTNGVTWVMVDGVLDPAAPVGRVGTGTFSATLRPRDGGDAETITGSFRGCETLFPACMP